MDFKTNKFIVPLKEVLLNCVWSILNYQNKIEDQLEFKRGYSRLFKYCVGNGNNSHIIRNLMHSR